VFDGQSKARNDFVAIEFVVFTEYFNVFARLVDLERPISWIDDDHYSGACFEPLRDLFIDFGVAILKPS